MCHGRSHAQDVERQTTLGSERQNMDACGSDMESCFSPPFYPAETINWPYTTTHSTTSKKVRFDHYDLSPWHIYTIYLYYSQRSSAVQNNLIVSNLRYPRNTRETLFNTRGQQESSPSNPPDVANGHEINLCTPYTFQVQQIKRVLLMGYCYDYHGSIGR